MTPQLRTVFLTAAACALVLLGAWLVNTGGAQPPKGDLPPPPAASGRYQMLTWGRTENPYLILLDTHTGRAWGMLHSKAEWEDFKTPPSQPAEPAKEARGEPIVALRLEAKEDHGSVRISVFLENLTDKPVKLRDKTSPAFSPWPCLKAKVDGKEGDMQARAAFAVFFDKAEERTIAAKKRFNLGDIMVTAKGSRPEKDEPLVPILYVEPGTHEIQLSLKRDEITLGIPGAVSPACITVKVNPVKDKGP